MKVCEDCIYLCYDGLFNEHFCCIMEAVNTKKPSDKACKEFNPREEE